MNIASTPTSNIIPEQPKPATVPPILEKEIVPSVPVPEPAATPVQKFIEDLDKTSANFEEPEPPAVEASAIETPETPAIFEESTPEPVAQPVVASSVKSGNYRIQVYSLRDRAEAEQHKEELIQGGFDAFLKRAVSAGQDWYIVYVGPFTNINSAKVNLKALKFSGREPILLSVTTTS